MVTDENMTIFSMGSRIGFVRHAAEYWLLANVIADRLLTCNSDQVGTSYSIQRETNLAVGTGAESIPPKYDQTSMQQVNDLISVFQRMQIIRSEFQGS
jgi:hypothetical protein